MCQEYAIIRERESKRPDSCETLAEALRESPPPPLDSTCRLPLALRRQGIAPGYDAYVDGSERVTDIVRAIRRGALGRPFTCDGQWPLRTRRQMLAD